MHPSPTCFTRSTRKKHFASKWQEKRKMWRIKKEKQTAAPNKLKFYMILITVIVQTNSSLLFLSLSWNRNVVESTLVWANNWLSRFLRTFILYFIEEKTKRNSKFVNISDLSIVFEPFLVVLSICWFFLT